jgi:threonine aldolase
MEKEGFMEWIDLRSDTVTKPTEAMWEAMAQAEVGDDVYGEDPTVNNLQSMAAERFGKEAALFIPSGTMGNLVAIMTHCHRGDEAVLGDRSHTYLYEAGGVSALGGIHTFIVPNQSNGKISLEDLESAIRPDDAHFPRTRLLCLENTHNRCGGSVLEKSYIDDVAALANKHHIKLHMDGARIFNAAVALGLPVAELTARIDTLTFCLSKGLCAPVGSVLVGDRAFIAEAHRIRKQLGGGMRQVGILAAAGIIALEEMVDRLAEDHARAKDLAKFLMGIPGIGLDWESPDSNMLFFHIQDGVGYTLSDLIPKFAEHKIRISTTAEGRVRLVMHYWIDDDAIHRIKQAFREIFGVE